MQTNNLLLWGIGLLMLGCGTLAHIVLNKEDGICLSACSCVSTTPGIYAYDTEKTYM